MAIYHSEEFHFAPEEPPIIQPGYRPGLCKHNPLNLQDIRVLGCLILTGEPSATGYSNRHPVNKRETKRRMGMSNDYPIIQHIYYVTQTRLMAELIFTKQGQKASPSVNEVRKCKKLKNNGRKPEINNDSVLSGKAAAHTTKQWYITQKLNLQEQLA